MRAVICDLDGTAADCRHRLHHLPNWTAFFDEMHLDDRNDSVHVVVTALAAQGIVILYCSGRPEKYRCMTEEWLKEHRFPGGILRMRPDDYHESDAELKARMLDEIRAEGYDVLLALDDRPSVVDVWRSNGVECFQVNDRWGSEQRFKRVREPTLTLLVGPSGAGKSTWLSLNKPYEYWSGLIVSSDGLRRQLCGNFKDQSQNDAVFAALHALVATRLDHGLDVVVDATNIRRKDRTKLVALAKGGRVIYRVFNRSMEEKQRDGGWRLEVPGLLERHEQTFKSNLKDILRGDGFPNVTVHDMRITK